MLYSVSPLVVLVCSTAADEPALNEKSDQALKVQHVLIANLGPERIRHAVARRGRNGERLVGWRYRVVEFPFAASAAAKEVVAARERLEYSNGGCAMDVDRDGVDEIVVARSDPGGREIEFVWFKEAAGKAAWIEHVIGRYESPTHAVPHDIQPFEMPRTDAAAWRGIVAVMARQRLVWYEMPRDPRQPWTRHDIATLPAKNQSGLTVGDVSGRGRADLLCGMYWVECPADPARDGWKFHRFGDWDKNGWGGMAKHALVDLDGDGTPEIVASEAEIPAARLGVFRAPADRTSPWECRVLDAKLYCPHSLIAADLDRDGRQDIVVGEMSAGGWSFPRHPNPRLVAWLNQGEGRFSTELLFEGVGIHEMGATAAGAGTLRLYGADEIQDQKFPDMRTQISFWLVSPNH
ncbi:MAG: VCBS repeat-containing protein [Planctomycetes bacterium]|nr:VCBS repeat-containing protein [Planctomycetota bacterium]